MRKVVYNNCYGGFGLSREAAKRLREGLIEAGRKVPEMYKGAVYTHPDFNHDTWKDTPGCWEWRDPLEMDPDYYDVPRHDPLLVQIVEDMGDSANGSFAKLRIEQLGDGVKYRIDEYDGNEQVMTQEDYDWV